MTLSIIRDCLALAGNQSQCIFVSSKACTCSVARGIPRAASTCEPRIASVPKTMVMSSHVAGRTRLRSGRAGSVTQAAHCKASQLALTGLVPLCAVALRSRRTYAAWCCQQQKPCTAPLQLYSSKGKLPTSAPSFVASYLLSVISLSCRSQGQAETKFPRYQQSPGKTIGPAQNRYPQIGDL